MELKELCKNIFAAFDVEDTQEFASVLNEHLLSGKTEAFEKYAPLCPDIETDYLSKIWQFYESDRDEKKQDFSPKCLGELLSALAGGGGGLVYDCCAGSGALTIQYWLKNKNSTFICEEIDERILPFLIFNLAIRNMDAYVIHGDVLEQKRLKMYRLTKGAKYSEIAETDSAPCSADYGISNPPFNVPWKPMGGLFDNRFSEFGEPERTNANFAFISHVLGKVSKKCAFILPANALEQDKAIKARLIEKGLIQSVILLPHGMFESTDVKVCIVVFDKTARNEKVVFIDATDSHSTEIREQRGEGKTHYARIYKKEIPILSLEDSEKIIRAIEAKENELGFCAVVSADQIKENGYNLSPAKYIEKPATETKHRPFMDIANDINRCRKDKNKVKLTINETLALRLGLAVLAEDARDSNRLTDEMNGQGVYKTLGIKFEKEEWLTLTKNKSEIKIENLDKEDVSHLLLLLLPQFQQHIYYLNLRENEYLAEMRDAMLPALMNGTLKVE